MIYLSEGNLLLNECYDDEIVQEANSTYQLSFKFPTSDDKWKSLKEEALLVADDLHGEQVFTIFEIVKQHGYVTVYANQVASLLNHYSISQVNVDRVAGNVVMSALAGSIVRKSPFSFYSDIMDKHTLNVSNRSAMDVLVKDKHSIIGQWGGDLVRDKYQVKLLKNGGVENESLFMYKKNMRSYQQTTSTKELRTRIHFRKKIEVGEGDAKKEQWLRVTVDSPLINKYQNIYEADMEVQDEDIKDLASLTDYGKQYYRTTLCDLIEDSLELDVVGTGDVPVKMFDVVTVYHERFDMDMRKKITKYRYSPMGKRLKSVGFGTVQRTLGGALGNLVSDAVKSETAGLADDFDARLEKELENANRNFDRQKEELTNEITDGIEQAKAEAEKKAQEVRDSIHSEFRDFETEWNKASQERDQRIESALTTAGASSDLANEAKQISSQILADLESLKTDSSILLGEFPDQLKALKEELGTERRARIDMSETLDGIQTSIDAVGLYFDKKGRPSEKLSQYVRSETAESLSAMRVELGKEFVKQSSFTETVAGINRRFEQVGNQTDTKIAQYDKGIDGRFAKITSQMVSQTDFQKVQETSKLYERIIGANEADAKSNIARMVMTNQIFQTEVSKLTKTDPGGPNMVRNSRADDEMNFWEYNNRIMYTTHAFYFNGQKRMFRFEDYGQLKSPRFLIKRNTQYTFNVLGFDANSRSFKIILRKRLKGSTADFENEQIIYEGTSEGKAIFNSGGVVKKSFTIDTGAFDEAYLYMEYERFDRTKWAGLYVTEFDFYEGTTDRSWQPSPDDVDQKVEAVSTRVTQLNNSWAVQHLTSAGSIAGQINSQANQVLIDYSKIRLKGTTLADEIQAIDGKFNKLFVADGTFSKLNAEIFAANSITADKLRITSALAEKMVADKAFLNTLLAKDVIASYVKAVEIDATLIRSQVLKALSGAMTIDLDNAITTYQKQATIAFATGNNMLYREKWNSKLGNNSIGYLMFRDSPHGGVMTTLGNVSHQTVNQAKNADKVDSDFAGIRIFRDTRKTEYDRVEVVADRIQFRHAVKVGSGLYFQPTGFTAPSHGEGGHHAGWNLGVLLEHFRQNFERLRQKFPDAGLNVYGYPIYNINNDQSIGFDRYI